MDSSGNYMESMRIGLYQFAPSILARVVPMSLCLEFLGDAQPCAAGTWVSLDFLLRRSHGSPGDLCDRSPVSTGTDRLPGRAEAICAFLSEEAFYDPVFQRVK